MLRESVKASVQGTGDQGLGPGAEVQKPELTPAALDAIAG